jgi:hypothetical protein
LILIGLSLYLKNFNVSVSSSYILFIGLFLLALYSMKREQPYIIFGGIFTAIGAISLLKDLRFLRLNITFEVLLIVLGIIFVFLFYSRNITSFVFPGFILPALGVYLILVRTLGEKYTSSSIFLLLGIAFYIIYFIAYMGKSNWPLALATILLSVGIFSYLSKLGILNLKILFLKGEYIWPIVMILAGVMILFNRLIKKNKGENVKHDTKEIDY